nr:hypothetical protein [Tanacetum cinerariifolium]
MSIEIQKKEKLLQQEQWAYLSTHPSKRLTSFCYDDDGDEDYTSAITPDEPGIPKHKCDVPSHDNSPPLDVSTDQIEDFSKSNNEFSSIDDDYFSLDNIDYVEASPPDFELVSLEVIEIVVPEDMVEDISPTKEPQVHNALPTHPTLQLNMKFQPSSESLFIYVVWIFLPFLVYLVAPHYLLSLRNEDAIFDPGIYNSHFSRLDLSHRCGTVKKFNTHRSHLNECPMMIHGQNNPILDVLLFYFYPP